MSELVLGPGTCLAFGGTNARVGLLDQGDIVDFNSVDTPEDPNDFALWMARQTLLAADRGDGWVVAGFPGPVAADGTYVGPMANVRGMKDTQYDLGHEMTVADPAIGRLLNDGFTLINVNDGELAAQAAAVRVAEERHKKVGILIIGSGNGAGIVNRDQKLPTVFRPDRSCPTEIGHLLLSDDPFDTYENMISGPAIERVYDKGPRQLDSTHPVWRKVGVKAAQLTMILGLMQGAELVVPTGGVGAGASDKYGHHLRNVLEQVAEFGNATQKKFIPEIVTIDPSEAQVFELYGAEGVMRDFMSRA